MTISSPAGPAPRAAGARVVHLSELLNRPLTDTESEPLGRLSDVIVRLRGHDYPLVTGLVAAVEGRDVFVPIEQVVSLEGEVLKLTSTRISLRRFERRDGEVLLRADIGGHRLIDVPTAHLVRANDLELARRDGEWLLAGVDIRRRRRRVLGRGGADERLQPDHHPGGRRAPPDARRDHRGRRARGDVAWGLAQTRGRAAA